MIQQQNFQPIIDKIIGIEESLQNATLKKLHHLRRNLTEIHGIKERLRGGPEISRSPGT